MVRHAQDRDRLVPCPACEGVGQWHRDNGTLCYGGCGRPVAKCLLCDGELKVKKTW